jgi:arginyl-tRNA synthetase
VGEGRTVVVDYSSPNIAKRMHIGHLRSTNIGDCLRRLYLFLGWTVVGDNHVGDWGTQFGMLIVGWHHWRDDAAYEADAIGELQRIYQLFRAKAADDEALHDAARAETAKLQSGDPENMALWQRFIDASMVEFDAVYDRLGVHFDVTHGESFYRDEVQPLVDDLLARGIAEMSDGAAVVTFTPEDGKGLGKNPLLIRKSDGAALYGTTDLCTVNHRVRTWGPERAVYVTDGRQQQHFRQVFAASRKMGVDSMDFRHVWFGILRFPGGEIVSTRGGVGANLLGVLDTAVSRARAVVDSASADLSEDEKAEVAEMVGVGAIRYFDLSQNPQSDITFDWERSLALDGNSAPYLMYAHARCCSVLRKAEGVGAVAGPFGITDPHERRLALAICRLPEVVMAATETHRPNLLCDHLYTMTQEFSRFWTNCRVLGEDIEPAVTASRLTLVQSTARALHVGLGLLGLGAPERM